MGRPINGKNGGGASTTTTSGRNGLRAPKPGATNTKAPSGQNNSDASGNVGKSDRSQTNFPYDIRLGGFSSLYNAVTKGSPKMTRILTDECDYIMECRVCRNLFRSVPNFLTHKQNYCKKVFDSTWSIGLSNLVQTAGTSYDIQFEVDPELVLVDVANPSLTNSMDQETAGADNGEGSTCKVTVADYYKELAIRSQTAKKNSTTDSSSSSCDSNSGSVPDEMRENESVLLQIKPLVQGPGGSIIVQQQLKCDPSSCDITSAHVKSVEVAKRDSAILGPDGKVMCTGTSKGIEQVVAKLSARLQTMANNQGQKTSSGKITCEICKTVFDTEKGLRQHKRESLDCGKTWGFKSPVKNLNERQVSNSTGGLNPPPRVPVLILPNPAQRSQTNPISQSASQTSSSTAKPQSPVRISKFFSPTKARPCSHKKVFHSTVKAKRTLALSPLKRRRLPSNPAYSSNATDDCTNIVREEILTCSRCSQSCNGKHEMAVHLSMCTGMINYAHLKINEKQEKIGISVRHQFEKAKSSTAIQPNIKDLGVLKESQKETSLPPVSGLLTEVRNVRKQPRKSNLGALDESSVEVNNNGKCKYEFPNGSLVKLLTRNSSLSAKCESSPTPTPDTLRREDTLFESIKEEQCVDANFGNNSIQRSIEPAVSVETENKVSTSASAVVAVASRKRTAKSRKSASPSKVVIVGQVSTRLKPPSGRTHKVFNLRKAINSRIRKSRRLHQTSVRVAVH